MHFDSGTVIGTVAARGGWRGDDRTCRDNHEEALEAAVGREVDRAAARRVCWSDNAGSGPSAWPRRRAWRGATMRLAALS